MRKLIFCFFVFCSGTVFSSTEDGLIAYTERLILQAEQEEYHPSPESMEYLVFDLKLKDIVKFSSSSILYPYKATIKLDMLKVSCDSKQFCSKPVPYNFEKYLIDVGLGEGRSTVLKVTSYFVIDGKQEQLIITDFPKHIKSVLDVFEK